MVGNYHHMIKLGLHSKNRRIFFIFMLLISIAVSIDVFMWNLFSIPNMPSSAGWSTALFVIVAGITAICQYPILSFVKQENKISISNWRIHRPVTIIQFVLTAILIFITLQVALTAKYSTIILIVSSTVSYVLGIVVIGVLAILLMSWYKIAKSFAVLMYCLSSIAIAASLFLYAVQTDLALEVLPHERDAQSELKAFFDLGTLLGNIQYIGAVINAVTFFLLWLSSAILLKHYARRIGVIKFGLIISIPIISIVNQYVVVTPIMASLTNPNTAVEIQAIGNILPGIVGGILFGLPYWAVSRTISNNTVKGYMIIAMWGNILVSLSTSAGVWVAAFPPYGVFSITILGLSCYLILVGIYSSAISISADTTLRRSIKKYALEETRLLDSIGMARVEQEIRSKVLTVVKENSEKMAEESGIIPSLRTTQNSIWRK